MTFGDSVYIDGGAGSDSINILSENSIIHGGAGNDVIHSYYSGNTIDGGAGNDYIDVGSKTTIKTGAGNDTINVNGSEITIEDLNAKDMLAFITNSDSSGNAIQSFHANTSGSNLVLTGYNGSSAEAVSITLTNMTDTSKIDNLWVVLAG